MSEAKLNQPKLGIIAGGGSLPFELAKLAQHQSRPYVVAAIKGFANEEIIQQTEDFLVDFGKVGFLVKKFTELGVKELILGGYVKRPSFRQLRPDRFAAKFLAKVSLKSLGDNSLLEAVKAELSSYGFKVIGIDDLTNGLFVGRGAFGAVAFPENQSLNLSVAIHAAKKLGAEDKGQAVLVSKGEVIALEGPEGTDAMLKAALQKHETLNDGMLLKAVKPQQDRHVDLPAIGLKTIELANQLSLKVVAIEAGGGLILQKDECLQLANEIGTCLYGFDGDYEASS